MNGFCLPSFLSCFRIYDIGLRAGLLTYYYIACLCIGCGTNKHRMQIDKKTMQLQLFIILLHYLMAFQSNDQGYLCSCNKKFSKAFKILLEVVIRDIYLSTGNFSFPKASFFARSGAEPCSDGFFQCRRPRLTSGLIRQDDK